ncbi:NACHT domain-containing protein [Priestia megaterium]|uniref:NACHT domain-containing protein n=1 Tax=Priestia megaterium TaxID=1404 RepID=UPI002E22494A|nr:NACHT domain-containing protein [Priestia megaterium]
MTWSTKENFKKEGLHTVKKKENDAAIIFVHGLRGHPYGTWTKKDNISLPELLAKDEMFQKYDLFTFGYKTGISLRQHRYQEISKLLYTELKARLEYKEIYFVAHSMGGLIVQRLIIDRVEREHLDFLKSVKGIIYLSVPFYGAIGGNIAKIISSLLPSILGDRIISIQVKSLAIWGEELYEQSRKWALYSNSALSHIRQQNIYGLLDRTVKTFSASPAYIHDSDAVQENHRTICKVDEKSTVYQLIGKSIHKSNADLIKKNKGAELELSHYLKWLREKTSDFVVPGIRIPLNIEEAWASIQIWEKSIESSNDTLEIKLKKYHEWERLSESETSRRNAQELTLLGKHIILIGGPGSGKSTLVKRTVNQLVSEGKKVLYIKLNRVSKEMSQGKSFEDALWETATESYIGNKGLFKSLLLQPDVLIADGLDECEPNRKEISSSLREWGNSRSNTQVIITTRPIGYEFAYFHDYNHMEILPLDEEEIYRYAPKLINVIIQKNDEGTSLLDQFKQQLEENRTASIAARSPLLLNFLIQLSVSGKPFGTYRAELYSKILDEWMRNSERGEYLNLNPQVALGALEWLGWNLQDIKKNKWGRAERHLISGLGLFLSEQANVKKLEAKELAYKCLKYWTEKGVLEHLKIGHEDAYVFIHLTLSEYAAARYFINMDSQKQKEEFFEIYRDPLWREPLLLAGGEGAAQLLVEELLGLEPGKYGIFNDMVLAAAILAETYPIEHLNKQVLERLMDNICSSIPMLAYEAGRAADSISLHDPEWVASLAMPLTNHPQPWTRLVSIYLCLKVGKDIFDTESYIDWISTAPEPRLFWKTSRPSDHFFWNETIVRGLRQVLNQGITKDQLISVSKSISKSSFSARSMGEIRNLFEEQGVKEAIEILNAKFSFDWGRYNLEDADSRMKKGDLAFLQTILGVIPHVPNLELEQDCSLLNLAKLYEGMKVGEMIAGDLYPLVKEIKLESVRTVIKGMIHVLGINETELFKEIHWALNKKSERIIFTILPDVPTVEPSWEKAKECNLNFNYLVEALGHPSETTAMNAACLIHEIDDPRLKPLIIEQLSDGNDRALKYVSIIIPSLYEKDALNLLLDRLNENDTKGFRYLYEALVQIPGINYNNLVCNALTKGISNVNSLVAKSAAKAMLETKQDYNEKELKEGLVHWDRQGVWCKRCENMVKGSSCPGCNVIPPSPIPDLLDVMYTVGSLEFDDWLHFSTHDRSDVRESAKKGLTKYLSLNLELFFKLINDIKKEDKPAYLLDAIFEIESDTLFQNRKVVLDLIGSQSFKVRKRIIEQVADGKWLNREEAYLITQQALEDEHLDVRDQAVLTMRRLDIESK